MSFFKPEDLISVYTSNQAVEDGILVDLTQVLGKDTPINLATTNLLTDKGYMDLTNNKINIPNLRDLIVQCIVKMRKKRDTFYEVSIELPSGTRGKVFVAQNETGKFTVMLPSDY